MTKEEAKAYVETIGDDEPVFVLRGKDRFMPSTVRRWCDLVEASSAPDSDSRRKVISGRMLAKAVEDWQSDNGSKVPD